MKINLGDGGVEVTAVDDVDLDAEDVHVAGKRLTESAAGSLAEEIVQRHARKRAGRPSLGEGHSPRVSFRVSVDMRTRLAALAEDRGVREADLLREALQEYLSHH